MTTPASIDIILVNRNAGEMLARCVRSIVASDRAAIDLRRVCIVDDDSTDGSAAAVTAPSLPLEVRPNPGRLGYGASCNRGAGGSTADYLLFLNTDIELQPDALAVAIAWMERREAADVGIAGIRLYELDGSLARSCSRFPTLGTFVVMTLGLDKIWPAGFRGLQMSEWDHRDTRQVDQTMGAFMMMRRRAFEVIGGFDERFFVYMEDLDLALRARHAGWRSAYLAESGALHLGGGTARRVWSESLFFAARSRVQYARKHWGVPAGIAMLLAAMVVEPVTRVAWAVRRRAWPDVAQTLRAYGRLWRWTIRGGDRGR